jgi:hypothetical protein
MYQEIVKESIGNLTERSGTGSEETRILEVGQDLAVNASISFRALQLFPYFY